jgi:peptidoglycan/LPS O-acetylase OafA/YrhL
MVDKQVFQTMNGLRGIAALVVVAFHWSLRDPLYMKYGFLSVDLFFVLSGFVIAHSYGKRLESGLSVREFVLIRLIRLYPLYALGTLLGSIVILASVVSKGGLTPANTNGVLTLPFAFLMLPAPPRLSDWMQLYPLNGPAWSLLFELVVNIFYAATVRYWRINNIIILMLVTGPLLFVGGEFTQAAGWDWPTVPTGLLRVMYSFPAGVLIYELYKRKMLIGGAPAVALAFGLIGLLILPLFIGMYFSVLFGFPILVALAAMSEPKGLALRAFSVMGAASYAIYAIHEPLHWLIKATLIKLGFQEGMLVDVVLIVSILPICVVLNNVFDGPGRKYLSRKLLPRFKGIAQSGLVTS